MATTNIEWADRSWNAVVGCSIVSPGCTNCYAMAMARRIEHMAPIGEDHPVPQTHYFGTTKRVNGKAVWTGKVARAPDHILTAPLRTPSYAGPGSATWAEARATAIADAIAGREAAA